VTEVWAKLLLQYSIPRHCHIQYLVKILFSQFHTDICSITFALISGPMYTDEITYHVVGTGRCWVQMVFESVSSSCSVGYNPPRTSTIKRVSAFVHVSSDVYSSECYCGAIVGNLFAWRRDFYCVVCEVSALKSTY
jgi:hypothetical protein